jgi:hypothetical protein
MRQAHVVGFAATLHYHRATTLVTPSCWVWQPWLTWALEGPSIIGAHDPFHNGRLNHSAFTYRLRVSDDATERRSRRALGLARLSCVCSPDGHGDHVRPTSGCAFGGRALRDDSASAEILTRAILPFVSAARSGTGGCQSEFQ